MTTAIKRRDAKAPRIKINGGMMKAADILAAYIEKQDRYLESCPQSHRQDIIGRKLGAIEFFEEMMGMKLNQALKEIQIVKSALGNGGAE